MLLGALWEDALLFLGGKVTKKSVNLDPCQPAKREWRLETTSEILETHSVPQFFLHIQILKLTIY